MQEVNDAERSEIQMLRESLSEARRQQEMVLHDKNLLLSQSVSVLLIFVVVFASGPILSTSRKSEQKENWNDVRIFLLFFSLSLSSFFPTLYSSLPPTLPPPCCPEVILSHWPNSTIYSHSHHDSCFFHSFELSLMDWTTSGQLRAGQVDTLTGLGPLGDMSRQKRKIPSLSVSC